MYALMWTAFWPYQLLRDVWTCVFWGVGGWVCVCVRTCLFSKKYPFKKTFKWNPDWKYQHHLRSLDGSGAQFFTWVQFKQRLAVSGSSLSGMLALQASLKLETVDNIFVTSGYRCVWIWSSFALFISRVNFIFSTTWLIVMQMEKIY